MKKHLAFRSLFGPLLFLLSTAARAQEAAEWDPLFVGYESEPSMDFGGRTVASLQSVLSRGVGSLWDVGERRPGLSPAWEFPLSAVLLLVQHEVDGHGGRGREFDLSPSYGFGYDLSAYTTIDRVPRTNEEGSLLAAGGTEADQVMARRIFLDLLGPDGADGAKVPLAFMAKLDLTMYIAGTEKPDGQDFLDQLEEGNDIAYWLVSRQSARLGGDPADVWNSVYAVDLDDPLLERTSDDARTTALWNLLDPSLVSSLIGYFRQHVLRGETRVRMPVFHAGDAGLMVGTRGALGPREVSRFLDLHATGRWGVATVSARDLDSGVDRTYGFGAGVRGLRLREGLELGFSADTWEEPESLEGGRKGTGWNATAEVDALFGRWGLSAKAGAKSEGFYPGLPIEDGPYVGLGLLGVW